MDFGKENRSCHHYFSSQASQIQVYNGRVESRTKGYKFRWKSWMVESAAQVMFYHLSATLHCCTVPTYVYQQPVPALRPTSLVEHPGISINICLLNAVLILLLHIRIDDVLAVTFLSHTFKGILHRLMYAPRSGGRRCFLVLCHSGRDLSIRKSCLRNVYQDSISRWIVI